jgi:hypothetical protein
MSFWTGLFGGTAFVDIASKGVDAAFFTPEERARHYIEVLKHIEPFKIAQRWLMLIVVVPYTLVWVICAAVIVCAIFVEPDRADQLLHISDQLASRNNDNLGTPVALIMAFYFAGGAFEGIIARIRKQT